MIKLLLVGILGFFLMGSSCKEDVKSSDSPPVKSATILDAVCYTLQASQLTSLKIGERSVAAKSMAFFNGGSELVEAHRLEVLSQERGICNVSGGGQVPCDRYEMFEELQDIKSGEAFHFEREMLLPVVESDASLVAEVAKVEREAKSDNETMDSSIDQEICFLTEEVYRSANMKMTYYNFTKKNLVKDPPPLVRQKPDCGGLSPCKIQLTEYQFDQEIIGSDGSRYRRHFIYEIAKNVPFTSRYMNRCITHSIPQHFDDNDNGSVEEGEIRIVPVHECREVRDFAFGS